MFRMLLNLSYKFLIKHIGEIAFFEFRYAIVILNVIIFGNKNGTNADSYFQRKIFCISE